MSTLQICLFIGALLPILLSWVGGYYRATQLGTIDNRHPRQQAAQLEGAGARAVAAQQNAWEALAMLTAGVVVHSMRGGDAGTAATLGIVWVGARVLHAVFYIADLDKLRSLAFLVAEVCVLALFFV